MNKVKSAVFLKSESKIGDNFAGFSLPEIAIVGRSNVGKSSFLNALSNNSKLAKTSSTPGRTRLVNFFEFNKEFVLVDLPGYGFNMAGKQESSKWDQMISAYFESSKNLKAVLLLVDIRHKPTELDEQMMQYAFEKNLPVTIVATKKDKIKKSELEKNLILIASTLKVGRQNIIITSAEKKEGFDNVLERIYQFVEERK